MRFTLDELNGLNVEKAKEALSNCCGASLWVDQMIEQIPFQSEEQLFESSRTAWFEKCQESDVLEAFDHHPKIGDKESLREKFASTSKWASKEQSGVEAASEDTLELLARNNEEYLNKNGFIFLVCATGKSALEMSNLLNQRLQHSREEELTLAKGEQYKITLLRLQKLMDLKDPIWNQVSQITTHVLDTALGKPGENICIRLKEKTSEGFEVISMGVTNRDGRVKGLLGAGVHLEPGHYQMCFDTGAYFEDLGIQGFYPKVDIDFETFDTTHYHVPLLINPFGYSTYRGS